LQRTFRYERIIRIAAVRIGCIQLRKVATGLVQIAITNGTRLVIVAIR
jgi:hypothetical protein